MNGFVNYDEDDIWMSRVARSEENMMNDAIPPITAIQGVVLILLGVVFYVFINYVFKTVSRHFERYEHGEKYRKRTNIIDASILLLTIGFCIYIKIVYG